MADLDYFGVGESYKNYELGSLSVCHLFHRCLLFVVVADLVVVAFCVRSGGGCLPVCCFDGGCGYLW